jgi:hypothetical protein
MGTSRNATELAGKFSAYALAFGNANRSAVQAATQVYKDRLLDNARRDTGGDLRLSRWRRRYGASGTGVSPKLGAGYEVFGTLNAKSVLRPRPYGIWALLEGGAGERGGGTEYVIKPFRYVRGRRKGEGNSALKFPNGDFAASVTHRGVAPKNTFSDATRTAEPGAKRVFAEAHRRGLLEVFK